MSRRPKDEWAADGHRSSVLLQHRIKNMLAKVRALASETYRNCSTLDDFYEAFDGRLQALAFAHIMAGRRADGMVGLMDLILEQLLAEAISEPDKVSLDGPDLLFEPDAAQTFALVIHELITNAIKYGALSCAKGWISVRWRVEAQLQEPRFEFNWQETGVRIATDQGEGGFGRRLIEEALAHQFGGEAVLTLPPDGCRCWIGIPMGRQIRLDQGGEGE